MPTAQEEEGWAGPLRTGHTGLALLSLGGRSEQAEADASILRPWPAQVPLVPLGTWPKGNSNVTCYSSRSHSEDASREGQVWAVFVEMARASLVASLPRLSPPVCH
jgi:hypothetical protein